MAKAWTKAEEQILRDSVGAFSLDYFKRKTGRSRRAIYTRTHKIYGAGGLSRGTHSLESAASDTGYSKEQFWRAQSALDQKWKRLSPKGRFLITFEQLQSMVDWLQHDYWCARLRLYGCANCGSSVRPARGMGLCPTDYWRVRRMCARLDLPSSCSRLLILAESLDEAPAEVRALRERLEKGWGPTTQQIETLASVL